MTPNRNALWSRLLIGGFFSSGVRHLCVCPGSRSAPLATAAIRDGRFEITVHTDERSASFFALGIGKATRNPAVLICTSGTAAANCLPAVIEADLSRVPMIIVTADRPAELRWSGAAQTIDQLHLYGRAVRFFQDLPLPELSVPMLRMVDSAASHARALSVHPIPGPIHLNVPFRDPLAPIEEDVDSVTAAEKAFNDSFPAQEGTLGVSFSDRSCPEVAGHLARIEEVERGLIVTGPDSGDESAAAALCRLARVTGFPLLADVGSGVRYRDHASESICSHAELFLEAESLASKSPELVLWFGRLPTSKSIQRYLNRHRSPTIRIAADPYPQDPDRLASWVLESDAGEICTRWIEGLAAERGSSSRWSQDFRSAEAIAEEVIEANNEPFEAQAVRRAIASLRPGSLLFLSNSLPVRHAEAYASLGPENLRTFVSRGANGIDGISSTAFGVAQALKSPLLLVTGDLAFLHDLGGLSAGRTLEQPVVILLLNNNGGGIFSYLPIAAFDDVFERVCVVPHDCDLEHAARLFGFEHTTASDLDRVSALVEEGIGEGKHRVIEIRTERSDTFAQHRDLVRQITDRIDKEIARSR